MHGELGKGELSNDMVTNASAELSKAVAFDYATDYTAWKVRYTGRYWAVTRLSQLWTSS
jgi:hypothetical protein